MGYNIGTGIKLGSGITFEYVVPPITATYLAVAGVVEVVILSVPTVNAAKSTTGTPTITTSGANTIYKFTQPGSITF